MDFCPSTLLHVVLRSRVVNYAINKMILSSVFLSQTRPFLWNLRKGRPILMKFLVLGLNFCAQISWQDWHRPWIWLVPIGVAWRNGSKAEGDERAGQWLSEESWRCTCVYVVHLSNLSYTICDGRMTENWSFWSWTWRKQKRRLTDTKRVFVCLSAVGHVSINMTALVCHSSECRQLRSEVDGLASNLRSMETNEVNVWSLLL